MATYKEKEDLISIGAYQDGSNPRVDYAKAKINDVYEYLKQGINEKVTFDETVSRMMELMEIQEESPKDEA